MLATKSCRGPGRLSAKCATGIPFVAGLEYVSGSKATIVGKPSTDFFDLALKSMDLPPGKVAMIGDDIDSDVGGGQNAGLLGILVKTGKYREDYVAESDVEPDAIIDSFADLPRRLVSYQ